jgi:D-serine deaminase-like pyridoxal phosphate-dependent protein
MIKMGAWYELKNIAELDTPALVIYPDRVRKNIELLKSMIDHVGRLRPHVKTNKSIEAVSLMLEAGIRKFKCATIAEAEMLGMAKAADVLLAYQPIGPKIDRLITLIKTYPATKYSCLVDNMLSAEAISSHAQKLMIQIPVYIDLNVGMNRTGIVPGDAALELWTACENLPGVQPKGLHAYDGHITDVEFEVRKKRCDEAFAPVQWMLEELTKKGIRDVVIIAGGSPSFTVHAQRPKVECSPGTFIFWDAGYVEKYKDQPFLPAALVVTRVISLPNETTVTADLGHKSVAAENTIDHRVQLLNAPGTVVTGQSEEHLVLKVNEGHSYKPGDVLYGLPYHICPTVALYERAFIVDDGEVRGEWKIVARDRRVHV